MKGLIILTLSLFLSSCGGQVYKNIQEVYYLKSNPDVSSAVGLDVREGEYFVGVIRAHVIEVGYNQNFIIAKQREENFLDNSRVNYYIIPLTDPVAKSRDDNVIGPLSAEEFELKRETLKMPKTLDFTINVEDLR